MPEVFLYFVFHLYVFYVESPWGPIIWSMIVFSFALVTWRKLPNPVPRQTSALQWTNEAGQTGASQNLGFLFGGITTSIRVFGGTLGTFTRIPTAPFRKPRWEGWTRVKLPFFVFSLSCVFSQFFMQRPDMRRSPTQQGWHNPDFLPALKLSKNPKTLLSRGLQSM